jgi:hypothetical protein
VFLTRAWKVMTAFNSRLLLQSASTEILSFITLL